MLKPYISVVIPVYNEEKNLEELYRRLISSLDGYGKPYEIILTNDGSHDKSGEVLYSLYKRRPAQIRVIEFSSNFGQHMAIMAGFERARGQMIVTLDADLQNPPEEIPKLLKKMEEGYDVVNTYRENRQDRWWRCVVSKGHNKIRHWLLPKIKMQDQGCMLRAYQRHIVDLMIKTEETTTFIPALALSFAANPAEIPVKHAARVKGKSNYNLYRLVRYNFDLLTSFSILPLQVFTFIGFTVSSLSLMAFFILMINYLFFATKINYFYNFSTLLFFLLGIIILGVGILGEYIGRIYQEVRKRPRFLIQKILE